MAQFYFGISLAPNQGLLFPASTSINADISITAALPLPAITLKRHIAQNVKDSKFLKRFKQPFPSLCGSTPFPQFHVIILKFLASKMGSLGEGSQDQFSDYEKIYLQMSKAFKSLKKEHWAVHCVCSITHKPRATDDGTLNTQKALRDAWKRLAVEYPGLTVRPVELAKRYVPLNVAVLENWASETFFVEHEACADDIIADFEPRELPSLHYLPHDSEIVLVSQHWRTDALGCCLLMNRFFKLLELGGGTSLSTKDISPLSPCLEVAAGASPEKDVDIQAYSREYIDAFHNKAVNAGGLPFEGDTTRPPGRTKHHDLTFTISRTQCIVQACKNQGMSVSAAIHVALARTYFSFVKTEEEKEAGYTTVMAVNMRPHLPVPYNEPTHACQTYVVSITPTVPYSSSFPEAARALKHEYQSWYTEKFRRSLCWLFKYHAEKLFAPLAAPSSAEGQTASLAPRPLKPPSGITLSSLGVLERHLEGSYGDCVTVEKFRFGVSMMTRQTLLYAWTFRGELTLSLDYNEAYYSHQVVAEVLSRVRENLAEGLKVKLD